MIRYTRSATPDKLLINIILNLKAWIYKFLSCDVLYGLLALKCNNRSNKVTYDNDPIEIGFNVNYLLEALGAMDSGEFTLSLSGPDSSGLLQSVNDPATRYVVMPMRL